MNKFTYTICLTAFLLGVQPSFGIAREERAFSINVQDIEWLEDAARSEIKGCRVVAEDGTVLFTPDGVANYNALWTRDFAYMLQLFDLFDPQEAKAAVEYLLAGQREDGVMPDRRQADGVTVYEAGGLGNPVALPPLDNSAFMVDLVYIYVTNTNDYAFFKTHAEKLHRAMLAIPLDDNGLVWNDPQKPHSPYGFTDTVGKTGSLFFCSLLDWKASNQMVELSKRSGNDTLQSFYEE